MSDETPSELTVEQVREVIHAEEYEKRGRGVAMSHPLGFSSHELDRIQSQGWKARIPTDSETGDVVVWPRSEHADTATLTVYERPSPDLACPVRGCDYATFGGDRLHDHVSDEHPEVLDSIMTGEVVVHE